MLQKIMVPLITVKGKSKQQTQTREVEVIVVGQNHKMTTSRHRFQWIQAEPVSDRVKPVTLKVGVFDEAQPVTDVVKVTLFAKFQTSFYSHPADAVFKALGVN